MCQPLHQRGIFKEFSYQLVTRNALHLSFYSTRQIFHLMLMWHVLLGIFSGVASKNIILLMSCFVINRDKNEKEMSISLTYKKININSRDIFVIICSFLGLLIPLKLYSLM